MGFIGTYLLRGLNINETKMRAGMILRMNLMLFSKSLKIFKSRDEYKQSHLEPLRSRRATGS